MCTSGPQTSGQSGCGARRELGQQRAELVGVVGVAAAAQLEPLRVGGDARVGGRLDPGVELERGLADPAAEAVAGLVAVRARLVVAEPPVERREVARAALQEDALDAGDRGLDRLAQRADVLGVPEDRRAADGDRVHGEADDGGERRAARAVDADHRDRVVDGALALDAVAGEAGRAADGGADARRLEPAPGGVDGAGELVAEQRRVALEGGDVGQAADRRAARRGSGALWLWLACTETALAGMPVERGDALAHRRWRARRRRRRGRSRRSRRCARRPRARAPARPAAPSRPARAPCRAAQQPTGSPSGGVMSTRATPAGSPAPSTGSCELRDVDLAADHDHVVALLGRSRSRGRADEAAVLRVHRLGLAVGAVDEVDRGRRAAPARRGRRRRRASPSGPRRARRGSSRRRSRARSPPARGRATRASRPRPRARRSGAARCAGRSTAMRCVGREHVPAAAELGRDDDLPLPLGLADEQPGAGDVDVDEVDIGVPREHRRRPSAAAARDRRPSASPTTAGRSSSARRCACRRRRRPAGSGSA